MEEQIKTREKRGYVFSLDALIALIVIVTLLLAISPSFDIKRKDITLHQDILSVLLNVKVGESKNAYVINTIIPSGLADLDKSLLEQMAFLHAMGYENLASGMAQSLLNDDISPSENVAIYFDDYTTEELIAQRQLPGALGLSNAKNVWVARQVVGGIQKGNVTGFSARAFLTKTALSKYFYFGGYIGQGNISANIEINGSVINASMEIAINDNFTLYSFNPQTPGSFKKINDYTKQNPSAYVPEKFDIPAKDNDVPPKDNFYSGNTTLVFVGKNGYNKDLFIAGGYIKIIYSDSNYVPIKRNYFPGIEGIINLYDSFYIPNTLTNMKVFLRFNSSNLTGSNVVLNIGNVTVFNETSEGRIDEITLTDADLKMQSPSDIGKVNYSELSNKTIPIRLWTPLINVTGVKKAVDVILTTDLSGSMSGTKLSGAKTADKEFVEIILNISGNRVGLVSYGDASTEYSAQTKARWDTNCSSSTTATRCSESVRVCTNWKDNPYYPYNNIKDTSFVRYDYYDAVYSNDRSDAHIDIDLTINEAILDAEIDSYSARGGTCIACGIHGAVKALIQKGDPNSLWYVVIMSDGQATMAPIDPNASNQYSMDSYMPSDYQCNVDYTITGKNAAIAAATEAYQKYNITVYSIGFGSNAKEDDLREIAVAGNGEYYFASNSEELKKIYRNISQNLIYISYISQIANITGNISMKLFPDSFIEFTYPFPPVPKGTVITAETPQFGNIETTGSFFVPSDAEILEANIVSYSSENWTHRLAINNSVTGWQWTNVFRLADYGQDYRALGDPYVVNIPISYLAKGNNYINISASDKYDKVGRGAEADKAIYTILREIVGYSKIAGNASGCIWEINFSDGTTITIKIPSDYTGTDTCKFEYGKEPVNNALSNAIYHLLSKLDINGDSKIDTKFDINELQINATVLSGIPYTYKSEVKIVVWR